ncbi:PKD domain-containing protein [Winogradskyella schleiferi]|uniref:PKD domain-containing protein n=1 Tax=Winogradskyella schleiferi TaxID=2686078 RepID=UPI0015B913D1|nr:PKD domain-containing protein [Winogradskyella schleiferi]
MKNKMNIFRKTTLLLLTLIATSSVLVSCVGDELFRDDLPDANSKADTVPPSANFSYASDQEDFRIVNFTDLSIEANTYLWDFGGGVTSNLKDPSHTFAGVGTYPVSLTASDSNGQSSTITIDVEVIDQLVPIFQCPSFECSPRTPWAGNGGETSTFTGSSGPTPPDGSTGAKLSSSSQWLDQTILVSPATTYTITFWHVSVPGSTNSGALLIQDADSGQNFVNEDIPASATSGQYYEISYTFTTGSETENLRFRLDYAGFELRVDLISIQ